MAISALLGPADDLTLAAYYVGMMSRLHLSRQLASAYLVSLKSVSGSTWNLLVFSQALARLLDLV